MTTPIFILGVAPRCGTNFIEDLLCVHPDCGLGIPLRENQVLGALPEFDDTITGLARRWGANKRWGFMPEHAEDLAAAIGKAIVDFTVSQVDDRRRVTEPPDTLPGIAKSFKQSPPFLVSKYPRAGSLPSFRRFLPEEKLVILMRDGRAVAESSIRSWGWPFDVAVDNWRSGAQSIADWLDANPDDDAVFIRYEDILTSPETEIPRLFDYLGLDLDRFDMDTAMGRPVRGSSTARPTSSEKVTWEPVAKSDDFDPLARARDWTDEQHARFNHMAGDLSERFGYPLKPVDTTILSPALQTARDAMLAARAAARPFRRALKQPTP